MLRRTALHWSCKQGHTDLVRCLLQNGADPNIRNDKGELPASLTDKEDILDLLPRLDEPRKCQESLPITPHFMMNPPFPYKDMTRAAVVSAGCLGGDQTYNTSDSTGCVTDELLRLKLGSQRNKRIIDEGLGEHSVNTCRADADHRVCTNVKKGMHGL